MPQTLNINQADFEACFLALLTAKREDSPDVDAIVADIIADVRARGDDAVIELTEKFDRLNLTPDTLAFSREEIMAHCATVPTVEREALERIVGRIEENERQMVEALTAVGQGAGKQTVIVPAQALDAFGDAFKMLKGRL